MNLAHENAQLREQLELKDAEIAELRGLIFDQEVRIPSEWNLTRIQARILRLLLKHDAATREKLHTCLYGDRADGGPELDNIRVHICLLRKKLKPRGMSVGWCQERGYYLDEPTKSRIYT